MDIQSVGDIYQKLNKANLHLLKDVYHQDVVFEDSAHRLEGLSALSDYFQSLYANVIRCDFIIHDHQQVGDTGFLTWTMDLQHPKLHKGAPIAVSGVSHMKFSDGQVIYHRDYFDLGEMLYEHLPLLGSVIKTIKQRLGR
ncbi:TPA: nuclear transport factor 2 family protein [Vibrio parahaemolyticus]|uniref:nuclear transport factor 2 family protein n=1 Tax=Vibrio TaxID=662 RepID=UPI001123DB77|nr:MULTISPECIES: nuclear transport factor 2 family protein [Vibrio]EGQ9919877.1 nuclear transport factor 2 family protein [Vibrio parahaemolyticus]MDF4359333.1 nuclear transport factor 2 family protein [Vibrio parahaemolyticus]MDF4541964.1 nuclear transport factor 2 family protein [Vibrio parahaemolyticus]MDG2577309.1 nuclear transport factor 2 family protein [Vibrio parahaemolyticus]MDG2796014.1 nuclear transport factor 2 family protein [Vibrio parahaemolyticus]